MENFVPPPLFRDKIGEIAKLTGRFDFFEKNGRFHTLRVKGNGYCVFFDEKRKACDIYAIRPFDCMLYPFDFIGASRTEGIWLIWECSYSKKLDDARIEENLVWFEQNHATDMFRMWDYANDTVDLKNPDGFRVLRKTKVAPQREIAAPQPFAPASISYSKSYSCRR